MDTLVPNVGSVFSLAGSLGLGLMAFSLPPAAFLAIKASKFNIRIHALGVTHVFWLQILHSFALLVLCVVICSFVICIGICVIWFLHISTLNLAFGLFYFICSGNMQDARTKRIAAAVFAVLLLLVGLALTFGSTTITVIALANPVKNTTNTSTTTSV